MERVYNFAPGPSNLAEEVILKAQKELFCYKDTGMSVLEMSHRSPVFSDIYDDAVAGIKKLMKIPDNYEVLFLQGGATQQFSAVALNMPNESNVADYIDTGNFAYKAAEEATRYKKVNIVASSKENNYTYIPELKSIKFSENADYTHITTNNTIYGTRYSELPDCGDTPIVADASSNILSENYDVSKFGVIYAGAQKNIGPAGLCVVIIRKDLIVEPMDVCPKILGWKIEQKGKSMVNTPNCFGIYMAKLGFEWLQNLGGVDFIEKHNIKKANIMYEFLDQSKLFKGTAQKKDRSRMNVTFVTGNKDIDAKFIAEAAQQGLVNIKGHRIVGGMRASIYNAMPIDGVTKLVNFMEKFEKNNI